jgi:MoxR-like ATPase
MIGILNCDIFSIITIFPLKKNVTSALDAPIMNRFNLFGIIYTSTQKAK